MTQNTPVSNDISQTGATKAHWLAAFNNALDGQSGGGLFDSLMGELDKLATLVKDATNASTTAAKPATPSGTQTSDRTNEQSGLQNAAVEVHQFVCQWHDTVQAHIHTQNKTASSDQTSGDEKKTADKTDPASQNQTSGTTAIVATPTPTIAQSTTPITSSDTSNNTSSTGTPDLNNLIATMQALLQNLQTLQKGASPAAQEATLTTGNTGSLQDAGAMLLGLLKLAQKAAGQLSALADNAAQTAAPTPSPSLDAAFLKDLKNLVDQFQSATQSVTQTTVTQNSATTTQAAVLLNSNTVTEAASAPTPQNDTASLMQATLNSADRLMQQLQKMITGQSVSTQADAPAAPVAAVFEAVPNLGFTEAVFTPNAVTATSNDTRAGSDGMMDQGTNNGAAPQTNVEAAPVSADGLKSANTYSFASQLSGARGNMPASLPAAVEQAMVQMSRNIKAGNDQMTLQLRPAELGQINIKLTIASDGSVTGTVVASHQATLDLLTKDRSGLERALQEAGLNADSSSLQFSLGGQQGQETNNFAERGQQQNGVNGSNNLPVDVAVNDWDESDNWIVTPGRVNLKV